MQELLLNYIFFKENILYYFIFFLVVFVLRYLGIILYEIAKEEILELTNKIEITTFIFRGVYLGIIIGLFYTNLFLLIVLTAILLFYVILKFYSQNKIIKYLDIFVLGYSLFILNLYNNLFFLVSIFLFNIILEITISKEYRITKTNKLKNILVYETKLFLVYIISFFLIFI